MAFSVCPRYFKCAKIANDTNITTMDHILWINTQVVGGGTDTPCAHLTLYLGHHTATVLLHYQPQCKQV